MNKLMNGEIDFAEFDFLNANSEKAIALCEVSDELKSKLGIIKDAFEARRKELDIFMIFRRALSDLWGYSQTAVKHGMS